MSLLDTSFGLDTIPDTGSGVLACPSTTKSIVAPAVRLAKQAASTEGSVRPLHTTKLLQQLARKVLGETISNVIENGQCRQTGQHWSDAGNYACTISCEYRTKRPQDLFRHEEIVYPQHIYFCPICGDPAKPLKRHLFTRKSRLKEHLKKFHQSTLTTMVELSNEFSASSDGAEHSNCDGNKSPDEATGKTTRAKARPTLVMVDQVLIAKYSLVEPGQALVGQSSISTSRSSKLSSRYPQPTTDIGDGSIWLLPAPVILKQRPFPVAVSVDISGIGARFDY
ncbi:hypothetical protein EK21DRAFT_84799 [Setomelanomma holmii]|uniref:Uncharacterized protein n=1 Tax=Setomelanomma holmii TaxID=210430 RepID=A0A9P4LTY6_9PLEO|nr:hypothetical protein EK21DRAFT_84799 [Setomelanomma holmii]